jgi:hypothetical protein
MNDFRRGRWRASSPLLIMTSSLSGFKKTKTKQVSPLQSRIHVTGLDDTMAHVIRSKYRKCSRV